ncbi:MAG: serine--tRNA ligase [Elusimicrobiota bacterium]
MLDIKLIRDNKEEVKQRLLARNMDISVIDKIYNLDIDYRKQIVIVEEMQKEMNSASQEISALKKAKAEKELEKKLQDLKKLSNNIKEQEVILKKKEEEMTGIMLSVPNMPHETTPAGKNENDNIEISVYGKKRSFEFKPKDHVDIGEALDIINLKAGSKIAGARFPFLKGYGAMLEWALVQFMRDTQRRKGYTEIMPPFLANADSFIGTGQLPKFAEDLFKCKDDDYYLIPTAEVPLTNIHRGEILDEKNLPIKYMAYTPCFRREAGSYGKDTRGLIRNHQFNKIELVKIVKPKDGLKELESLTKDAANILDQLEMPYRIIELCAGDISFASSKTYDIEVWMPGENRWREISSCSLFTDFQARRMATKYKTMDNKKYFVYTLNGSGVAVGRTFAAVLENYQNADGSVTIPEVLYKYMDGLTEIKK